MSVELLRNAAIIAHVDHGKTTMVDRLLYQSGMFRSEELDRMAGGQHGLIMDSNPLERERGITILSKQCAIRYRSKSGEDFRINLIDTPGHADFGGEVERVLRMADGAILLIDAFEGPMPQTRFVLQKALEAELALVVVVNKADRPDARPQQVVEEVFDLLVDLGAEEQALDFPVVYASAREGWSAEEPDGTRQTLGLVLETVIERVPAPRTDPGGPFQMMVSSVDYSEFVGRVAIGRVHSGALETGAVIRRFGRDGSSQQQRAQQIFRFEGLGRSEATRLEAGEIAAIVGLDPVEIGDTLSAPEIDKPLEWVSVDEPTLTMEFGINDSPFAGQDGKYVTSRQVRARLERELRSNVALQVDFERAGGFGVSGRGLMHLGILLETMRREGYELGVGKPTVLLKRIDGVVHEPFERLVVDAPSDVQSAVLSMTGERRAEVLRMDPKPGAGGFVHLEFRLPARGLIGLRSRLLTATQGRAIVHHVFDGFEPAGGEMPRRANGVMIATEPGAVTSYALDALFDRGVFFVKPGERVYEGQIVGEHNREGDITVNVVKAKQLTNFRAAGRDDNAKLRPPRELSLEAALEYIEDDELVEVTPGAVRLRKRMLRESDRRRETRRSRDAAAGGTG